MQATRTKQRQHCRATRTRRKRERTTRRSVRRERERERESNMYMSEREEDSTLYHTEEYHNQRHHRAAGKARAAAASSSKQQSCVCYKIRAHTRAASSAFAAQPQRTSSTPANIFGIHNPPPLSLITIPPAHFLRRAVARMDQMHLHPPPTRGRPRLSAHLTTHAPTQPPSARARCPRARRRANRPRTRAAARQPTPHA